MHELDLLFSYKILHPLKLSILVSHRCTIGLEFTTVNTDGYVLNNLDRDTGLLLNGQGVLCMRLYPSPSFFELGR